MEPTLDFFTVAAFLDGVKALKLDAYIDGVSYVVCGTDESFVKCIKYSETRLRQLAQEYDDLYTLFVILAIDLFNGPLKIEDNMTYPSIEWRILHTPTNKEVDCHFSYQLPGDGSFFTQRGPRADSFFTHQGPTSIYSRPPRERKILPITFIEPNNRIMRVPILYIPKQFQHSVGYLAVQESEAILSLDECVEPTEIAINLNFIYSVPAKIVDRRKRHYSSNPFLLEAMEDTFMLFLREPGRFAFPILCRNEA